ncbi:MAG: hypothetical protein JWM44_3112 [Bacilli bacterium]|nr:hypothetical protein [Bacilli bacterium]
MSEELLNQILAELKEVKSTVNRIEKKLDSTHEQVVRNSESITEILDGHERQDRILELLSKRSLEQEADIKDFKRIR